MNLTASIGGLVAGLILVLIWDSLWLIPQKIRKIKRSIWNRGLRLFWCRLWIRKNEFHWTLDIDREAFEGVDDVKKKAYFVDIARRQHLAHAKDPERPNRRKNETNTRIT